MVSQLLQGPGFYDEILGLDRSALDQHIAMWNRDRGGAAQSTSEPLFEDWLSFPKRAFGMNLDVLGYFAARAIAENHGREGLREAVAEGPDRFIALFNEISPAPLQR